MLSKINMAINRYWHGSLFSDWKRLASLMRLSLLEEENAVSRGKDMTIHVLLAVLVVVNAFRLGPSMLLFNSSSYHHPPSFLGHSLTGLGKLYKLFCLMCALSPNQVAAFHVAAGYLSYKRTWSFVRMIDLMVTVSLTLSCEAASGKQPGSCI